MRITRGKTGSRRSHHKLKEPRLSRDTETDSVHLRHRVDLATGMYRGKKIFEVAQPIVEETKEKEVIEEKKDIVHGGDTIPIVGTKATDTSKKVALPQQRKTQDKA